jgi:hypothetical protein
MKKKMTKDQVRDAVLSATRAVDEQVLAHEASQKSKIKIIKQKESK